MCLATNKRRSIVEDPTRQAGNRRKAIANLRKRLSEARRRVLSMVDTLPVTLSVSNSLRVNRPQYMWEMSPERLAGVEAMITQWINEYLNTSPDERPSRWFFNTYLDNAINPAAAESFRNITNLASGIVDASTLNSTQLQTIFAQPQYNLAIQSIYGRAFNEMKGFAGQTAADLARVLSDSVMLGESARAAKRKISGRFDVADSRAERIARTEINRAYTVARTKTAEETAKRLELDVRVLHRSSLMPTTRKNHASRHGKVYTIQEQNDWWDENANRINCLCGISEVVVDKDGKMRSRGLAEKMAKQRELWFSTN